MPAAIILVSRWLHFVGFALAIGSALAITIARRKARRSTGSERAILESLIADIAAKAELPGLAIALVGGLVAVAANPIAAPWLVVKLALVLALFIASFVKMIDAQRIVRERLAGAKDDELAPIAARGSKLDVATVALGMSILFVTTFRFVLFA